MESKKMRAVVCSKQGLENLSVQSIDIPEPVNQFEIVLKLHASALNPVDYQRCTWPAGGPLGLQFPTTPGIDFCGVVHQIGKSVDPSRFIEGKTVVLGFGSLGHPSGSFAEYNVADSRSCSIVSESQLSQFKDLQEAASQLSATPCAGYTAYELVCFKLGLPLSKEEKLISNFRRLKTIVVTAGAGGVGTYCLQLLNLYRNSFSDAKQRDQIKIIATCSAKNFDYVKKLGATHVIDYNVQDIVKRVQELTNGLGADAWIDLVGQESATMGIEALGQGGHLCVAVDNADYVDKLFGKALSIHNVFLATTQGVRGSQIAQMGDFFIDWVANQTIVNEIEIINLDQTIESLNKITKGHVRGKIVISFL